MCDGQWCGKTLATGVTFFKDLLVNDMGASFPGKRMLKWPGESPSSSLGSGCENDFLFDHPARPMCQDSICT